MDETEDWEAENFKAVPAATTAVVANKWEGEDEDDEVKDNWEDEEEEEKKDVEKQEPVKSAPKKSKKNLADRIEEKERKEREEAERKLKDKTSLKDLAPEELAAEKLRRQKLQEESDLRLTLETFGIAESSKSPSDLTGIDAMNPSSKEEFDELEQALSKKITSISKSTHFPDFAEKFMRNICANLSSYELKKFKTTVENMFLEKSKIEKGDKAKKSKGKGKAKLKIEGENSVVNYGDFADDFDDFM